MFFASDLGGYAAEAATLSLRHFLLIFLYKKDRSGGSGLFSYALNCVSIYSLAEEGHDLTV